MVTAVEEGKLAEARTLKEKIPDFGSVQDIAANLPAARAYAIQKDPALSEEERAQRVAAIQYVEFRKSKAGPGVTKPSGERYHEYELRSIFTQQMGRLPSGEKASEAQIEEARKVSPVYDVGRADSSTTSPSAEARKQADIHGITKEGRFTKSLQQEEFEMLAPSLQTEYNIQAEESQRKYAEYIKQEEEQKKKEIEASSRYPTRKIGGAIIAESLLSPDVLAREEAKEPRKEGVAYDYTIGLTESVGVSDTGSTVQAEDEAVRRQYESDLSNLVGGIVTEGKAKGATKIQIYNLEDQPIGALAISGAEEPLKYLLRTGEFKYSFTVPKTTEEKAEQERFKEEQKQFKGFIKSEQKLGASGFEIYDKSGKLVTVTSADHPVYDIMKAQKEFGEVSVKPKFTTETILKSYTKDIGEPIEFTRGLADTLQAIGVEVGTGGSGTTEPPKEIKEIKEKYTPSTAIDPILSGRPIDKPLLYSLGSLLAFGGILSLGAKGGKVKATPQWIGVDVAKTPVKVIQPRSLTPYFKPTNMFREPIPKDIFKFDTAIEPKVSATPPRTEIGFLETLTKEQRVKMEKRNVTFEELSAETRTKLQKSQGVLLEPIKPRIEAPPKILGPTFTQRIETGGRPPISKPTDIFGETSEGATGLFSAKGKIVGTVAESGFPEGALVRMRTPRAEIVEATYIKPEYKVYSAKGRELGIFGEREIPLGVLRKADPFVQEPIPRSLTDIIETKGRPPIPVRPTEIFGESKLSLKEPTVSAETTEFTFIKPEQEVYSAKGKFLGLFGERPSPIGAMGKTEKIKLVEEPAAPTNIKDFYTRLARTKAPKKLGKIDTGRLLGGETPFEDLAAGKPPILKEYAEIKPTEKGIGKELTAGISPLKPKLRKEFGGFESPIERQLTPTQEEGIGALGKKPQEPIVTGKRLPEQSLREFAERLEPTIVKGKKIKPARAIRKLDTESVLGIEKKPRPEFVESKFRQFIEGSKRLKKEVQEVKGFEPNIRDFFERLSRTKPPAKGGKIDTDRLLGIEQPEVGAPKEFTESLPKTPTRAETKQLRSKQWSKAKEPAWKKFRKSETKGRQQLVQILEEPTKPGPKIPSSARLATKPAGKRIEPRSAVRLLIATKQEEEETYIRRNKLRPASRPILITEPQIKEGEKLGGILEPITGIKGGLKTGTELGTKPRPDVITKTETVLTLKEEEKVRLTPKLTPRLVQEMPTPLRPKAKQALAQPLAQKQPQKLAPIERIPPKPPRPPVIFAWPRSKRRAARPRETESGSRFPWIGNVPETRIEGIYKRSEVTYGQKAINKLTREDRRRDRKRYGKKFVKRSGGSLLSKTRESLLSRPKKKRLRL